VSYAYQAAQRWMGIWRAGEDHYGHCCAAALSEGEVDVARAFAAKWSRCHERFIAAWVRAMSADRDGRVTDARGIDWFGEGDA
jgi:hypothetical protein